MEPEQLALDVGRTHEEHPPVERADDLARTLLLLAQRVEEVDEAPLGKVVRGELLNDLPSEETKVSSDLQKPRGDSLHRLLRPRVRGPCASLADTPEVRFDLFGAHAEFAGVVRGKEPVLEEVTYEELVAGHVPEQERLPLVEIAPALCQHDQCTVAAPGFEATVQNLGDIEKPGSAVGADEVFRAKAIEILALRTGEVPRREDGVGLLDHRALHDGEGGRHVRARGCLHASPLRAYGTASAPASPRAKPMASWMTSL
jgi:hypothetical protein